MANALFIFGGILTLIIIGLVIYFIRLSMRFGEEPEDNPLFENYMPQYARGHTDGVIEDMELGDERVKITFLPRDIKYIRLLKKQLGITKPITCYFDKKFVESISEKSFSGHRQKIKAFPHEPSLLPEGLKKTEFGKAIMSMISKKNEEIDENKLLEKRLSNLSKVSKKTVGMDIIEDLDDIHSKLIDKVRNTPIQEVVRTKDKED